MSQIAVGPPDLKSADPRALALAKYLRNHELLKQRPALLNGNRNDFFRYKRAVRALEDPAYAKARAGNPLLPEVDTPEKMREAFRLLAVNRFAFNVTKLETDFALQNGLKPVSGVPCVVIAPQQTFEDEEYFMWFYSPVPMMLYLKGAGILLAVVALIAFPLWPFRARKLAWMASLWALVFVGLMIVLAIIRLILFCITLVALRPGIWLFPNLFADVGFIDSFRPLYSWRGQRTLPKKPKKKKRASKPTDPALAARLNPQAAAAAAAAGAGARPAPGGANNGPQGPQANLSPEQMEAMAKIRANPMLQQLMATTLRAADERAKQRVRERVEKEKLTDPGTIQRIQAEIMQEELQNVQADLRKMGAGQ